MTDPAIPSRIVSDAKKSSPFDSEESLEKLKARGENDRKLFRLKIGQEALRYVFGIIAGSLLFSFIVCIFYDFETIFTTPVMTVVLYGLFGVLTLILGFVAGTSID